MEIENAVRGSEAAHGAAESRGETGVTPEATASLGVRGELKRKTNFSSARQSRRMKLLKSGRLPHRMTDAEKIAALAPAYRRPEVPKREAPAGFTVLCPMGAHCFCRSQQKADDADIRIAQKCCGCDATRTFVKPAIKPEAPVTHEAEHKLVRRWQKA